jgi:hypothetical protein
VKKISVAIVVERAAPLIETIPAHQGVAYMWFCGPIIVVAKPKVVAEHATFRDVGQDDTVKAETELEQVRRLAGTANFPFVVVVASLAEVFGSVAEGNRDIFRVWQSATIQRMWRAVATVVNVLSTAIVVVLVVVVFFLSTAIVVVLVVVVFFFGYKFVIGRCVRSIRGGPH